MTDLTINAQTIPAPERHATIFNAFDSLEGGEALIIVNNHDPRPLLNKFSEERPDQFSEEYLTEGPSEWKVRLTKKKKEGCCGCCGM